MTRIGIDIGWSEKRPTCGIAVSDDRLPLPSVRMSLNTDVGHIRAARLTLGRLADLVRMWSADHPESLTNAIVVIDGPLGRDKPPRTDRAVDQQCGTGIFRGWSQPMRISHPSSEKFIAATYKILAVLDQALVWLQGEKPQTGIRVIETNPTVALATMMPRVGLEQICTRARPLPFNGALIAAKSDWYWRNGAGRQVARALSTGEPRELIAKETDHELCAALTCLALAHQFGDCASDGSNVIALGDDDGIYLLPADIDQTWKTEFPPVLFGDPVFTDHAAQCSRTWGTVTRQNSCQPLNEPVSPPDQFELAKGDCCILILADNGGAWEKHNPWLRDLESPVRVASLRKPDEIIELRRASGCDASGQWRVSPTAVQIARGNGWSSKKEYLSLEDPCPLDVLLLG